MTLIPRSSAAAISRRTQSEGSSSRRRPAASALASQPVPITAIRASLKPTFSSITAPKSSPGSMPATSMKTAAGPKRARSPSWSVLATGPVSSRR
jgi:hypothetical protein